MQPDRTKGQKTVLAAGLIVVGGVLVWLSVGTAIAVFICKGIRMADGEAADAPASQPLLGVVPPPRQPDPVPAA